MAELKELAEHPIVRKIVELDREYNFTDLILGFLAGFGIAIILIYMFPEMFPRVHVAENVRRIPETFPTDPIIENIGP